MFARHPGDPDSLQVIDLRPADLPEALAAGGGDALAASEPTPSPAEVEGAREPRTLGGSGNTYPILILAPATGAAPELVRRTMLRHPFEIRLDDTIRPSLRRTAEFGQARGITPQVTDFEPTIATPVRAGPGFRTRPL